MRWKPQDLILFTGAVYGLAWLLTKSAILRRPRGVLAATPIIGRLGRCVVCAAPWMAGIMLMILPPSSLISEGFRVRSISDAIVLLGWVLFSSWALARFLHDAD